MKEHMTRLSKKFEQNKAKSRKSLVCFITAGDPVLDNTLDMMHTLVESGADVIELGVPFSDPMADGPVIQASSERALEEEVHLGWILNLVKMFRKTDQNTPVVLMGYANPIESMGVEAFLTEAAVVGVDGVLVVDYPLEESQSFTQMAKSKGVDVISLVTPTTTDERMALTGTAASGFVYYVSLKGVTGAGHLDVESVKSGVNRLRTHTDLPIQVGFGISDAASAKLVAQVADGVVIGSKLISICVQADEQGKSPFDAASAWLKPVRKALDECR